MTVLFEYGASVLERCETALRAVTPAAQSLLMSVLAALDRTNRIDLNDFLPCKQAAKSKEGFSQ